MRPAACRPLRGRSTLSLGMDRGGRDGDTTQRTGRPDRSDVQPHARRRRVPSATSARTPDTAARTRPCCRSSRREQPRLTRSLFWQVRRGAVEDRPRLCGIAVRAPRPELPFPIFETHVLELFGLAAPSLARTLSALHRSRLVKCRVRHDFPHQPGHLVFDEQLRKLRRQHRPLLPPGDHPNMPVLRRDELEARNNFRPRLR